MLKLKELKGRGDMMAKYSLKCAIFVILFASFMFSGSAYPRGESLTVRYLIEEGIYFYEQGLLDDAIEEFNKVLSVEPDNFIAKEYLTKIRYELEMNNLMLSEQRVRETGVDQTIGDLSAQAMSLNERNKELELKLRTLSLDITMLKKVLANRNQQLAAISGQLSSSQSDKAREMGSIEERFLKAQYDKDREVANIRKELSKLQKEYDKVSKEYSRSSLKKKLDEARDTLETKKQEIEGLVKENQAFIRQREGLEGEYQKKASGLQDEIDQARQEVKELTNTLKEKNEAIQRREKKIRALRQGQEDMVGCKERIMARGDEIKQLEVKLADLQNEYEQKLSGSAAKMEKLKETLDAKDAEIKRIKSTSAQRKVIDELEAEKKAVSIRTKAEVDALQQEVSQAKSEINHLNKEITYRDNKLKQAESVFAEKLENELRQLKEEYEALLLEAVDTIKALEDDLAESREK